MKDEFPIKLFIYNRLKPGQPYWNEFNARGVKAYHYDCQIQGYQLYQIHPEAMPVAVLDPNAVIRGDIYSVSALAFSFANQISTSFLYDRIQTLATFEELSCGGMWHPKTRGKVAVWFHYYVKNLPEDAIRRLNLYEFTDARHWIGD